MRSWWGAVQLQLIRVHATLVGVCCRLLDQASQGSWHMPNQNDEEAARGEKGPEIFILSLAQDTSFGDRKGVTLFPWRSQWRARPQELDP
jgi:hypothetical protein